MKPIILFDIDLTLFNTKHWVELRDAKLVRALGVDREALDAARCAYKRTLAKSTDFDPDDYIRYLKKTSHAQNSAPLKKIFFRTPGIYHWAAYTETRRVLKALKRRYRLGLFTEGFRKFQLTKLKLAGLLPFFDRDLIFIHRRKLTPEVVSHLPQGALVVDDNREVVETLLQYPRVTPVWLNRKDKTNHTNITTIHTLSDLLKFRADETTQGRR